MNTPAIFMGKLTVLWALITATSLIQEIVRPVTISAAVIDPVIITLIGGMVVTVISAIVTGIVTVITALRVSNVNTRQSENSMKIDVVARDTEAIKGHVNSEKTAAEGVLALKAREIELLKESLQRSEQRAALLAQAALQRIPESQPSGAVTETPAVLTSALAEKTLGKIDENTKAIEKNTARTDASVQDLKDKA